MYVFSIQRKKAAAGRDNMTCTGTSKKYLLCNTKVSMHLLLPPRFLPLAKYMLTQHPTTRSL